MAEPAQAGRPTLVSLNDAAEVIGKKPWDVVRLIEAREVEFIQLVDLDSLLAYMERTA